LWIYFGGSVAGNVAHAPSILAAQLVAAVPPISAALTFHLLLRLLDRAPALRMIAEMFEERAVEEEERAALRRARRAQLKTRPMDRSARVVTHASGDSATESGSVDPTLELNACEGDGPTNGHRAATASHDAQRSDLSAVEVEDLRGRIREMTASGDRVTGQTVGRWLGVSARTGCRRLSAMLAEDPSLAMEIERAGAE
jgi:hypothetical protein